MLEETPIVGPVQHPPVVVGSQAGSDEVLGLSRVVEDRDGSVASAGELAGAFHNLAQDGVEVQARADAQAGGAQLGDAILQRLHPSPQFVWTLHSPFLLEPEPRSASPGIDSMEEPGLRHIDSVGSNNRVFG